MASEEPRRIFPAPVAERQLPQDPVSREDIKHVEENGYVVLENVFSKEEAEEAKAEMRRLSGAKPKAGRNPFEGLDTNRIYSLLNKSRVFDKFAIIPRVLALNDYFLDPRHMISAMHTIQINPGEKAQDFHHDDGYCNLPRPRSPLGSAILVAFDDFTTENGSTRIVPGSHKWPEGKRPVDEDAKSTVCPAGSVIYFIATTWHSGGANRTNIPRMSMTVQYCQPYIRPIENLLLGVDPRRLPEMPEKIVSMMGYAVHRPFIGYVDGLTPLRGAQRMVSWLQKPLDPNPPGFAEWPEKQESTSKL